MQSATTQEATATMQKRLRESTHNNSTKKVDSDSDRDSETSNSGSDSEVEGDRNEKAKETISKPCLPIAEHALLSGHRRAIISLATHPDGTRLLSGGLDHELHWYDYHSMNVSMIPFRNLIPMEGHSVSSIEWRKIGDNALVCADHATVIIIDREGREIGRTVRGDMYIVDARRTKGHTAATNIALWHPALRDRFITASADATIRSWNLNDLNASTAVLKSRATQRTTIISAMTINTDGSQGIFAMNDGSLRICTIGRDGNSFMDGGMITDAHESATFTSSIVMAKDNRTILTRGGDGDNTVKIWDIRLFRTPVKVIKDLYTNSENMNMVLSPDESTLAVGVAGKENTIPGAIEFYSRKDWTAIQSYSLENMKETALNAAIVSEPSSLSTTQWTPQTQVKPIPIRLLWPDKLNQIIVGCSDGSILQLFDRSISQRGVLLSISRKQTAASGGVLTSGIGEIIAPAAMSSRNKRQKVTQDVPTPGSGKWGSQGQFGVKQTMTAHLLSELIHAKKSSGQKDD